MTAVAECNLRAFQWNIEASVPSILIAVDESSAAKTKAMELFEKYQNQADSGLICMTLFSTNWFTVRTVDAAENILDQDIVGIPNDKWADLFSKIIQVYHCYSQKAKVFIIGDMQEATVALEEQFKKLSESPPNQPLKLRFCQIAKEKTAFLPSDIPYIPRTRVTNERQ